MSTAGFLLDDEKEKKSKVNKVFLYPFYNIVDSFFQIKEFENVKF